MRAIRFSLPILAVLASASEVSARPVSAAEARTAAANWLARSPAPLGARIAAPAAAGVQTVADDSGDALFHVVKLTGGGLVVTSAETGVEPVIAFSESDDLLEAEDNPLRAILLADMASRTGQVRARHAKKRSMDGQGPPDDAEAEWAGLLANKKRGRPSVPDVRVAPLLSTRWHQRNDKAGNPCANFYTTNHYACGCVALAGAQIANFWRYPILPRPSVTRTCYVSGSPIDMETQGGVYEWDSMPKSFDSPSAAQRQAVGKLCYDFGVATYMDWDWDGSAAGGYCLADAFTTVFGFDCARVYVGDDLPDLVERAVFACLDAGSPVAIGLANHEAVADGYGYVNGRPYTHINLGWDVDDDAWYLLPTVDGRYYQSTVFDEVVYNVFPQGTGDLLTGRVLDLSGNSVSGATVRAVCGSATATATSDARGIYALRLKGDRTWTVRASDATGISPPAEVWVDACSDTRTEKDLYFPGTGLIGNSWGNTLLIEPFEAEYVTDEPGGTFPAGARVLCGQTAHGGVVPGTLRVTVYDRVWEDDGSGTLVFRAPEAGNGEAIPAVSETIGTSAVNRVFYNARLARPPVPGSVSIAIGEAGSLSDDGNGNLVASGVSADGVVNYANGVVVVGLYNTPSGDLPLVASYRPAAEDDGLPKAGSGLVLHSSGAWTIRTDSAMPADQPATLEYQYQDPESVDFETCSETVVSLSAGLTALDNVVPGSLMVVAGEFVWVDDGTNGLTFRAPAGDATDGAHAAPDVFFTMMGSTESGRLVYGAFLGRSVVPGSVAVRVGDGGAFFDEGTGRLSGLGVNGSGIVNYATGAIQLTFNNAVESGLALVAVYRETGLGPWASATLDPSDGSTVVVPSDTSGTDVSGSGEIQYPSGAWSVRATGTWGAERIVLYYARRATPGFETRSETFAASGGTNETGRTAVGLLVPGSVQIAAGPEFVWIDNGAGELVFQSDSPGETDGEAGAHRAPGPGTIRYETGEWEVVLPAALSAEEPVVVRYSSFVPEEVPAPVFRFYSKKYKGHFFTIDEEEKDGLIAGNPNWRYEGTAYRAYTNETTGTVALYRFYSKKYSGHFFTIDEDEMWTVRNTNPNWRYEGIAYYVYPEEVGGSVPVFRFWSKGYRHHFYTIDEAEKDNLIATNPNWKYERIAFYALPEESDVQRALSKKLSCSASGTPADDAWNGPPAASAAGEAGGSGDAGSDGRRSGDSAESGSSSAGSSDMAASAPWSLVALPSGTRIVPDGVVGIEGGSVETRGEAPDPGELESHAESAEIDSRAESAEDFRLALPPGLWNAMLWSAEEGVVAEKAAEGAFDFGLPLSGVWHWLRVRDAADGNADDAYSLWLRAE